MGRVLSDCVVILSGQAKTGGVVARKIRWDHKVLLELAGTVGSQAALADAYSVAVGQQVSSSTLNNYLYRDPDVRALVREALIVESEDVVSRTEILEEENRELRSALGKQRKESVGAERVIQAIEQALVSVEPPKRRVPRPLPAAPKGAHHRQLVCLSDFHGGEVVDPEVVQGLNEYDWQIMEDRAQEVVTSLLSHKLRSPNLTGIDVAFIGDMCSGFNHLELAVTNEFPLAEQGVKMGALMGQIVEQLVPHYENIRVISVEGNHPRLNKAPAAKNPQDNMDWVAANFAKQYLKAYPTVDMTIGRGSMLHEIAGRNIYVFHGDGIRSSMPGVPWGGVMRRVNQLQATMPKHIDHFLLGHFHQANLVSAGRIIGNGSLKGADEWVLKNFGSGDPPAQWLLTFDEKRSRMTDARLITPTAGIPNV